MRALPVMMLLGCSPAEESPFVDDDGDGFTTQYDCDDASAAVFPTADEVCDGVDNNCDGSVDESAALDAVTVYADGDFDGYGNAASSSTACEPPPGFIGVAGDCDDADATSNPGAAEVCDGADNDCNGAVDDDPTDAADWLLDADGDGYGAGEALFGCAPGSGYVVSEVLDCDDSDASIRPAGSESCRDGKINVCDMTEAEALAVCAWGETLSESSAQELISTSGNAGWAAVSTDLTGDGIDDLIVGVPGADTARLIPGPRDVGGDLTVIGAALSGTSGSAVGAALAAGDLDGDGYADLILGGPGAGTAWLLAGPITGAMSLGASTIDSAGWLGTAAVSADVDDDGLDEAILGDPSSGQVVIVDSAGSVDAVLSGSGAGATLALAGDVDGDGIIDVLVGAPDRQRAWLVYGPLSGTVDVSDGVTFTGSNYTRAGSALAGADLDEDGYSDPIIGAPIHSLYSGVTGVFTGGSAADGGALTDAPLTIEGSLGYLVGGDVDVLDDITGDGLPELLIGTGYAVTEGASLEVNDGPAEAYMLTSPGARTGVIDASSLDVTFEGPQRAFGLQVTGLSDVTGDGWADVFISSGEEDESCYLFAGPGY
ncbi:MAG: MopE-related protein [Myxococcota bacterium]|nr:MopE-related protein [Myxococcota bacterium]